MLSKEIKASTTLHTPASLWTGGTSTNAGMHMCGLGHAQGPLQDTSSVSMLSNIRCMCSVLVLSSLEAEHLCLELLGESLVPSLLRC